MRSVEIDHGEYTKLTAAELSDLVVGKNWNRQADMEAIRRLREGSEDVLGELLINLVPAVVRVTSRSHYADLQSMDRMGDVVGEVYLKMQTRISWAEYRGDERLKNWLGGKGGLVYDVARRFVEKEKRIAAAEVFEERDGQLEETVETTELADIEFPCGGVCDNPGDALERGELISVVKEVASRIATQMKASGANGERDWNVYFRSEHGEIAGEAIAEEFGITVNNVAQIKFRVNRAIRGELERTFRKMGLI